MIFEPMRHKPWLYRAHFPAFVHRHYVGDIPAVTTEDKLIAADVARYFEGLRENVTRPESASVWDVNRMGAADFVKLLNGGNIDEIATALNGMFHSRYIQGMSHGFRHKAEPVSNILVPTVIEDRLVSLAEFLGTVAAETPEQGITALALKDGLEAVAEGVEKNLGYSLDFPQNMGASGLKLGDRLLTMRQIWHVYMSVCMKQALDTFGTKPDAYNIVEIGGGYGGLCYWSVKNFGSKLAHYTIIDLPWVNAMQGFFLKKSLGRDKVAFWTDPPEIIANAKILLCSAQHYAGIPQLKEAADLYVNQDSFPEMPPDVIAAYLAFLKTKKNALLLSHNHENGTMIGGVPQSNPSQLIRQTMDVKRITRTLSAMRKGYAEELYRIL